MPPPRRLSSSVAPVEMWMSSWRCLWNSVAVVNPIGTSLEAAARILSALASEIPFTWRSVFFGVNATASTVWKPAASSFLRSVAEMPSDVSFSKRSGPNCSSSPVACAVSYSVAMVRC
eukprot:Amastigsp_a509628_311.p4 type:complete len:118 gc:universal Amastigsp_a509628_311:823-1176(+)